MASVDTHTLFSRYLAVVNEALDRHREQFPYKQIIAVGEEVLREKTIGATIYHGTADEPHERFTLRFERGRLVPATHEKRAPDVTWPMKEEYLVQVVDQPAEYVEHPFKLDLEWLKTYLNIGGGA